ncbi:MAG: hypothetical protein Q8P90_00500 [bacterium]|nr:hypothetical protein [bacterium]
MSARRKNARVVTLRLTPSNGLSKKVVKTFALPNKKFSPLKLTLKSAKNKFITRYGKKGNRTSRTWKLTKKGGVKRVI